MYESRKIKVLIVDDSAVMRQLLTAILQEDAAFEVVGTAADPYIAREKIKALKPHVLTLDIEMPGMDGITFLEKLMRLHPMPVVMISSLTGQGAVSTLRALQLGAVDVVAKPAGGNRARFAELAEEIRAKVRAASAARARLDRPTGPVIELGAESGAAAYDDGRRVIVIGASAGGTQAIMEILHRLPDELPPIAIVQHMPPKFTALFADHLNRNSALDVREASDGDRLEPGMVRVAPGGLQMAMIQTTEGYALKIDDGAPVNLHRPSVDVLFHSAAQCVGAHAMGILLTGMGSDGARGLKAIHDTGAFTLAQDQASSVIFGMPEQAIRLGAASVVVGLEHIPDRIVYWARRDAVHGARRG
jgi:two-component system, chemotaxis family, protein-glutamate methylesterase/glutaminase